MVRQLILVVGAGVLAGTSFAAGSDATSAGDDLQRAPICIAIVLPSVQGVEGSATEVGASVRDLFASFLTGPSMRVVSLDARLASQAIEEARQKECGRVLTATLTRKRGGGGLLGRVVGLAGTSVASGIPGGGIGTAVVRGVTVAATQAVYEIAASTKAKDEMRLEYKLTSVDGKTELGPETDKGKATADGEDLVTPLVEKAAEAIAAAVSR